MKKLPMTIGEADVIVAQIPVDRRMSTRFLYYDGNLIFHDEDESLVLKADRTGVVAARIRKKDALRASYDDQLVGGLKSNALGRAFTYPTDLMGQQAITSAATDAQINVATPGWTAALWCQDPTGKSILAPHNANQVLRVFADLRAQVTATQAKLARLTDQIDVATDVGGIEAAKW